jgi:hypothetical protein
MGAREAKTKSDKAFKLASKQAGLLRIEDIVFEFQV